MFKKKVLWAIAIVLLLAGGGYGAYEAWLAPAEAEGDTVLDTATVTIGDLSISATGSGILMPASEIELGFSSSGALEELTVDVGDHVAAGEVLARIDDATARQAVAAAEQEVIQAEQTLALAQGQAELSVAQAEADLASAQEALDELLDWEPDEDELELARANTIAAEASYQNTLARTRVDQTVSSRVSLDQAIASLDDAQENYVSAMSPERDWERDIAETREQAAASLVRAQQELEIAQASYDTNAIDTSTADLQSAWAKVLSARSTQEDLESPPEEEEITAAEIAVRQAELTLEQAKLDLQETSAGQTVAARDAELALEQAKLTLASAREALTGTQLIAPFTGTVTAINGEMGETVQASVIVLSNLDTPIVKFWVEESDMSNVAVGYPVEVVFEALPDLSYTGEVYKVEPVLVEVSGVSAVQAWATIDTDAHQVQLLSNMNADVEIVAGEATNALLVPVQALREVTDDQYAVFVVQDNGEMKMRMVEVGLQDFVNAEIISGLERGEVVSLGETTTSSSSSSSDSDNSDNDNGEPMMPMGPMFGGG